MIWTELYRPKTLADFIGNKHIVSASKRWMEMHWKGRAALPILIIHGRSGIGKTTLSHCLADDFGCAVSELNASDSRNVKDMARMIQFTGVAGFDTRKRLTILDEADSISKAAQRLIVKQVANIKQPTVLLVNDMDKIIPDLQKIALKLEMRKPTTQQKLDLAKSIIESEGLEPWDLKQVVESSESFRDVLNNLLSDAYGESFKDDFEGNKIEAITAMLRGQDTGTMRIAPDELLRFVYQNKIESALRDIDVWLKVARSTNNYRLWAHAFAVLELQRYGGKVNKPRSEFKRREGKRKPAKKVVKMTGKKSKLTAEQKIAVTQSKGLLQHLK